MERKITAAKLLRVFTVAPVMAGALIGVLAGFYGAMPVSRALFAWLFLSLLPLLAYPVSLLRRGWCTRDRQRKLAICFSVAGYVAGTVFSLSTGGGRPEKVIYFTYLLSGILTAVFSFAFRIKSSGHACGVSGPVAALCVFGSPVFAVGFLLLIPVFRASLQLKRHTLSQLLIGTAIPILCLAASLLLFP